MADTKRGKLIVIEGLDKAGKTTQIELLKQKLDVQKTRYVSARFPSRDEDGSLIGKLIRDQLVSSSSTKKLSPEVLHLLFAADRWERKEQIEKWLEEGINVILDRYSYSGIAYSLAQGVNPSLCKIVEVGLPVPDVIYYLSLPATLAATRKGFGSEHLETLALQEQTKQHFDYLFSKMKNVVTIDATQSISSVASFIRISNFIE